MAMKFGGFHEIRQIHGKDFICIGSDRKYSILVVDHEIWQISWPWNLADFMESQNTAF